GRFRLGRRGNLGRAATRPPRRRIRKRGAWRAAHARREGQRRACAERLGGAVWSLEPRRRRGEWCGAGDDRGPVERFENAHGRAARGRARPRMSAATMLVLYDDARARTFEPFASTRPLCEMRAGALLVRERWAMHFAPQPGTVTFAAGRRMLDFDEPGAAQPATGVLPAGTIIANARFAPALPPDLARAAQRAATCSLWRTKDALVAVRLRAPLEASTLDDGSITLDELHAGTGAITDLDGWWHEEVWDYIRHLGDQLTSDLTRAATAGVGGDAPAHATVIGKASIRVDASAEI